MKPLDAIRAVFGSTLKGAERACAIVACSHVNQAGTYFLAEETMAAEAGLSDRSARRAIKGLEAIGVLVTVGVRSSGTKVRRVVLEALPREPEGGQSVPPDPDTVSPRTQCPPDTVSPQPGHSVPPGGTQCPPDPDTVSPEGDQKGPYEEAHEEAQSGTALDAEDGSASVEGGQPSMLPPCPGLRLPDNIRERLHAARLSTVGQLCALSRRELLDVPGIGEKSANVIEGHLADIGRALKAPPPSRSQRGQPYAIAWRDAWLAVFGEGYPDGDVPRDARRLAEHIETLGSPSRARDVFELFLRADQQHVWPKAEPASVEKFCKAPARWVLQVSNRAPERSVSSADGALGFHAWLDSLGDSAMYLDDDKRHELYAQYLAEQAPAPGLRVVEGGAR